MKAKDKHESSHDLDLSYQCRMDHWHQHPPTCVSDGELRLLFQRGLHGPQAFCSPSLENPTTSLVTWHETGEDTSLVCIFACHATETVRVSLHAGQALLMKSPQGVASSFGPLPLENNFWYWLTPRVRPG